MPGWVSAPPPDTKFNASHETSHSLPGSHPPFFTKSIRKVFWIQMVMESATCRASSANSIISSPPGATRSGSIMFRVSIPLLFNFSHGYIPAFDKANRCDAMDTLENPGEAFFGLQYSWQEALRISSIRGQIAGEMVAGICLLSPPLSGPRSDVGRTLSTSSSVFGRKESIPMTMVRYIRRKRKNNQVRHP